MNRWIPISQLPDTYKSEKRMFVVIGINVPKGRKYTTDPYCVWLNEDGTFSRWPHDFEPTHFMELPVIGVKKGGLVKIKDEVTDEELLTLCISSSNRGYEFIVTDMYNDTDYDANYYQWAVITRIGFSQHPLHIPIEWVESVN